MKTGVDTVGATNALIAATEDIGVGLVGALGVAATIWVGGAETGTANDFSDKEGIEARWLDREAASPAAEIGVDCMIELD